MGAGTKELLNVLRANVISVLLFAVPVWTTMLTKAEEDQIESVLKTGIFLIYGPHKYKSYKWALRESNMISLKDQRSRILYCFTRNCMKDDKFSRWFEYAERNNGAVTRRQNNVFKTVPARTQAYARSPIPQMTVIANQIMTQVN